MRPRNVEEVSPSTDRVSHASWFVVFTYELIFTKDSFLLWGTLMWKCD